MSKPTIQDVTQAYINHTLNHKKVLEHIANTLVHDGVLPIIKEYEKKKAIDLHCHTHRL